METATVTFSEPKQRILQAALRVIRAKGYTAATLDDVCAQAGVTKGSFFHHFRSKDELALTAIGYWNEMTGAFFASAGYHTPSDPLDRVLGYVDFRESILQGDLADYTCLLGTLLQEVYDTHPDLRRACDAGIAGHIAVIQQDIEEAKQIYAPAATWTAESVGYFIQTVLQGSFIFAKAKQDSAVARRNLEHLKRYLSYLFHRDSINGEL
jgi:TetR/AcrR family transcriptional repressor of nem operon